MVATRRKTPTPAEVREKEILTPEEVAVMLACGRTLVYRLLAERVIPSFKIGRLRRVRQADVRDFVDQQMTGTDWRSSAIDTPRRRERNEAPCRDDRERE